MKFAESNAQKIAHAEIRAAIAELMHAVNSNNAGLVGFIFGADPPILIRFGNITETGTAFTEVLLKASEMCETKEAAGQVVNERVSRPREEGND